MFCGERSGHCLELHCENQCGVITVHLMICHMYSSCVLGSTGLSYVSGEGGEDKD